MENFAKKMSLFLLVISPIFCFSRQSGVRFEKGLTWSEIQKKAKFENKYIFVDCYASWCGPCKLMEKEVYTNDSVGQFLNANFISVKFQLDSSQNDDDVIKRTYREAAEFNQKYPVVFFPTFFFFSPEGNIVHKEIGYKDVGQFISISKEALDTAKQYFTLLKKYELGNMDFRTMVYLANKANSFKDTIAKNIAKNCIDNYLTDMIPNTLFTKENIEFLRAFTTSSKDNGFKIFFLHSRKIDSLMKEALYSESIVGYIISKEEIDPYVISASKTVSDAPDWEHIKSIIKNKYNEYYTDRTVMPAKIRWFAYRREWSQLTKNTVAMVKKYGSTISNWDLNDYGMSVLLFSNNKNEINEAINWMTKVVKMESDSSNLLPASLDTYANLLYKSGRKSEAIKIENRALNMAVTFNISNFIEDFKGVLEKMKRGQPTWLRNQ